MAIVLPTKASKPENQDPRVLVLMSNTKVGKTSSVLQLPHSLILDLEDGSGYYEGTALNLKRMSVEEGKGLGSLLLETAQTIEQANRENGKPVYDFLVIDTLTVVEELARLKATIDYKNTLQGKNFTGRDVVKELPKGQGYAFLTTAFQELLKPFRTLPGKALILLGHAKLSTIDKGITEVQVNDIELTGKAKISVMANADSIGLLYRNKKNVNQNILTFKTSESDLVCGSRSPHLRNREFVFSEYDPKTDTLKTNWDLIFTSLATKKTAPMVEVQPEEEQAVTTPTDKKQLIPM